MARRLLQAAMLASILSVPAGAAEVQEPLPAPIDLHALFASAPGVVLEDHVQETVSIAPGSLELVVARIGPDGKLVKACVGDEAAARRFLDAPLERLHTSKAQVK